MNVVCYRKRGHVKVREVVSDWEKFWITIYATDGFGYRLIASMLYGISRSRVIDREVRRVGRIARQSGCGCNFYRTGFNSAAWERLAELNSTHATDDPPRVSKYKA